MHSLNTTTPKERQVLISFKWNNTIFLGFALSHTFCAILVIKSMHSKIQSYSSYRLAKKTVYLNRKFKLDSSFISYCRGSQMSKTFSLCEYIIFLKLARTHEGDYSKNEAIVSQRRLL